MICPITNRVCNELIFRNDELYCLDISDFLINFTHCSFIDDSDFIYCPLCGEKNNINNFNCVNCRFCLWRI